MIKNFDQFVNENISTPHDFGDDIVELKQKNIKLLSQEVIDGNLKLDSSFMDVDAKFVKLKIVNGDIFLTGGQWAEIPEWLKEVEIRGGGFYCINNKLTSLKNCPQKIGTSFNCEHNKLKNLKGCPKKIGGNFICSFNKLMTSLEGCPEFVGGSFICSYNDLVSLLGCPEFIGGDFRCDNNYSFLRLPDYVKIGGKFINKL